MQLPHDILLEIIRASSGDVVLNLWKTCKTIKNLIEVYNCTIFHHFQTL